VRRPLLVANWKMNKTIRETLAFVGEFIPEALSIIGSECGEQAAEVVTEAGGGKGETWPEVVICPPFTSIPAISAALAPYPVGVGAQDLFWAEKGAYTGEVSGTMLKDAGCSYVIVGHSERRHILGESDEWARKKVRAALDAGLRPILCVGETLQEREAELTHKVCETMTREGLGAVKPEEVGLVTIAYEPVWAIGTGKEARGEDARDVVIKIRSVVDGMFGEGSAEAMRVLYGGSVKAANIRQFVSYPEIDGALVGGASLDPLEFARIALEIKKGRARA